MPTVTLYRGDCLRALRKLEANTFDSLITDPPAGIGFMGKSWDHNRGGRDAWIEWLAERMTEAHRTLKPGAYGLVWALPRTSHWTALALEESGFEIRDRISHLFGTGFPKNKGTQLKPACEDWWLIRKPYSEKSVEANVARWGTGGLRTDDCRLETSDNTRRVNHAPRFDGSHYANGEVYAPNSGSWESGGGGRWPSHVVFSHNPDCEEEGCSEGCTVAELDRQSGVSKGSGKPIYAGDFGKNGVYGKGKKVVTQSYKDTGGASRFFYCAKPGRKERDLGCRNPHPTVKSLSLMRWLIRLITPQGGTVIDTFMGSGTTLIAANQEGINSYGIEAETEYFDIARARIKTVCTDIKLSGGPWVPVRRG